MHRLTVRRGAGGTEAFVLRRWLPTDDHFREWALTCIDRESAALAGLAATPVPAPDLIASTLGEGDGVPALLMTRVAGRMNLRPRDPVDWVAQLASALARIHAAPITAPPWESWIVPDELTPPAWASQPGVWAAAIDAVRRVPQVEGSFMHGDYQHFNLLWSRERLTAVVDWANASTGPPDIDVGHCRLNLAVLFSAELADEFLRAYEAEVGRAVDPCWDLYSLLSYGQRWKEFIPLQVHGRAAIDLGGMDRRVEDTLAAAVARL